MRCVATARRTGRRCGRHAAPGSMYCRYHGQGALEAVGRGEDEPDAVYAALSDEGDLESQMKALRGVDDEIALLRMLIRKLAREGNVEAARRAIDTLCRALKVQYALEGRSAEGLAGSLAKVLDELGNEMGMAL